jgi:hypothetical protein
MCSKIIQFNEKLDHVKRFLQTAERGLFDDESINIHAITSYLKYISKTIIGFHNHDENERAPFNFKNVTNIIMDFIQMLPKLSNFPVSFS